MVLTAAHVEAAFARRTAPVAALDERVLATACRAMAGRFLRGGRLLAMGAGPGAADAAHVVVEFVHPVIVGKRALPALALPDGGSAASFRFCDHADPTRSDFRSLSSAARSRIS